MNRTKLVAALLITGLMAVPVWAHHSFASFDMDKTLSVSGTVKDFQWTNPHCWIIVVVPNADGAGTSEYRFESAPPVNLIRGGWTEDTLQMGDKVTVDYHPRKDGAAGGSFQAVTLPNGKRMGSMGPPPGAAGAAPPPGGG